MAKMVKIKNIDKVSRTLRDVFKNVAKEQVVLDAIGKMMLDRILFNARRGRSLENNVSPVPFKNLKPITKTIRRVVQKTSPQSVDPQFFKPNKANVTFTGQLLDSLSFKSKKNSVAITISGRRQNIDFESLKRKLSTTSGGAVRNTAFNRRAQFALNFAAESKQASTNSKVYDNLVEQGYGFIGVDEKGVKLAKKIVLDEFRRTIKKLF